MGKCDTHTPAEPKLFVDERGNEQKIFEPLCADKHRDRFATLQILNFATDGTLDPGVSLCRSILRGKH
jgi:hypothetical protein